MNRDAGEHRPSASAASPCVSGRLFLGGLLPSRARLRFAGLASVRPSTIPAQSTPVNLSSFSCLTHGVQSKHRGGEHSRFFYCFSPLRNEPSLQRRQILLS